MNEYNPTVFIKGSLINLTTLCLEDVEHSNWTAWLNDEETTRFMLQHRFPSSRESQIEFFKKEIEHNQSKLQLGIQSSDGGQIVGVISLQCVDYINKKAEIAVMIGESKYRQVRHSIEAHKLIIAHGFKELNLHRIYGGTLMKEWAELLCRTLGFKMEGVLREDAFKNGKYHDVFRFGLIKAEFKF